MSTEIEQLEQTQPVEPQVDAVHSNGAVPAQGVGAPTATTTLPQPKLWQQRRVRIAAGAVILLVLVAIAGNNFIARQYTPDGAVRDYLSALQSGDASKAWDQIQVSVPGGAASLAVVDKAAFQAALGSNKVDVRSFAITQVVNTTPDTSTVAFTYDTATGSKQGSFVVQRSGQNHFGIYPAWHLVIPAAVLSITLPVPSGTVAIDGKAVSVAASPAQVVVLPIEHQVRFAGSTLLQAQTLPVDALFATEASVAFSPKLTDLGVQKTKDAVKAAFAACAKQTDPSVDGCPQSIVPDPGVSGQWQVIGDPTQDLTVELNKDYGLAAVGHFQMVFAHVNVGITGTSHSISAGGYLAPMSLTATDVSVGRLIYATGLPGLQRPDGATDAAAKALVTKAFTACAGINAPWPADCPQVLMFPVENARWTLNGDPLANATVSFDPNTGILTVAGRFDMTINATVSGYPWTRASDTSKYQAYLLWNGQSLQLITIAEDWS